MSHENRTKPAEDQAVKAIPTEWPPTTEIVHSDHPVHPEGDRELSDYPPEFHALSPSEQDFYWPGLEDNMGAAFAAANARFQCRRNRESKLDNEALQALVAAENHFANAFSALSRIPAEWLETFGPVSPIADLRENAKDMHEGSKGALAAAHICFRVHRLPSGHVIYNGAGGDPRKWETEPLGADEEDRAFMDEIDAAADARNGVKPPEGQTPEERTEWLRDRRRARLQRRYDEAMALNEAQYGAKKAAEMAAEMEAKLTGK